MATAKLWWNGSAWRTSSSTTWVDTNRTGNHQLGVGLEVKIAAYDDLTIKMTSNIGAYQTASIYNNVYWDGTITFKSGSTTIGANTFTNRNITQYSSINYSGSVYAHGNANGTVYNSGELTFSGSTTIASPYRTITYDANGGSDAPAPKTVLYNIASNLSGTIPSRIGYTFLGWSKSATATTATYYSGDSITITADTTLYAVWKADSFLLTVNRPTTAAVTILKNGTAYTGTAVDYGDVLTVSFTPSSGYVINTATLNDTPISSGDTHTVTGDVAIAITTVAGYSTIATYDSVVETLGTFSLTVNRYNPDHYCKVRYYDSNSTLLDTSAAFTTSTSLAIPQSWFATFPNDTSLAITAELTTYTDSSCTTPTGLTDTRTFTVTADASMKPTLSAGCITLAPYNTGTGVAALTSPGYVKGFSKVEAVFDEAYITHASGASTAGYAIAVQNVTTSGTTLPILSSNTLTVSGDVTVTYKVTDTRGRSATGTATISVNDYFVPFVSAMCKRTDSTGTEDDGGTYMTVTPTATFTHLSDNAVTLTLHCKPAGGAYVSYGTITDQATTLFGGGTFSPDTSYVVKVTITDTVGSSSYIEISMPKRSWEFHIGRVNGDTGAAFGKVTEYGNTLQLASGWKLMLGDKSLTKENLADLLGILAGTNIKTVNGTSLLGSGNVAVQETLVSGTNIKTVNGTPLLGSGDVSVSPVLSTKDFTVSNISLNAGNAGSKSITVTRSGYTPIGVVGYHVYNSSSGGTQASCINVYICYLSSSTTVSVSYRNVHASAAAKFDLEVVVLYTKN